jgi:hypothetical protein
LARYQSRDPPIFVSVQMPIVNIRHRTVIVILSVLASEPGRSTSGRFRRRSYGVTTVSDAHEIRDRLERATKQKVGEALITIHRSRTAKPSIPALSFSELEAGGRAAGGQFTAYYFHSKYGLDRFQ